MHTLFRQSVKYKQSLRWRQSEAIIRPGKKGGQNDLAEAFLSQTPCLVKKRSDRGFQERDQWMIGYVSTISGSKLVANATTSLRSGSGTSNALSVSDRQRMKAA